jgi:polyhydroxybutyrate depolymerase
LGADFGRRDFLGLGLVQWGMSLARTWARACVTATTTGAVVGVITAVALLGSARGALSAAGQAPVVLTRQTWTVDGVERSALVAVPRAGASGARVPLVLVFHGHGGSSANAARTFRIHEAWPEAVVMYPQGLPTVGVVVDPEGRLPGWQQLAGGNGDRDLHLTDAMLAWATSHYPIDPARIFAAGHSNGGSMVYLLWAVRGDQFAAFASAASVFRPNLIAAATPKPAFIVAGREDALVPFVAQQVSLAAVLRLDKADPDGAAWAGDAKKHVSSIGADVISYIHPGGHPMPADTGALMVRFFKDVATRGGQ